MSTTLTKRQQQIFTFIGDFRAQRGYAPTVREIAAGMEISPQTTQDHLDAMVEKGVLTRDPGKQRSLRTPDKCQVHS
jgi:repressor LexA